jgi:hypothetical protein
MAKAALASTELSPHIGSRAQQLFDRVPLLLGFSFDQDLSAIQVELHPFPGHTWSRELLDDIQSLITEFAIELSAENPQGEELLRGRTFARRLH